MKLKFTSVPSLIILFSLILVSSCKNDIEIFAPQSDVTLVYGLLNADDTLHQIKINKVFQGDKAIDELAKDPSVSEYDNLDARVIELEYNGFDTVETGRTWTLSEVTITNKDSGYFYYPEQKVYEFTAKLFSDRFYKVMVDKLNGSPIVEGKTELIRKNGDILLKPQGLNFNFRGLSLAGSDGPIDEIKLEMKVPINAKIIEVYLDFSWQDEYLNGNLSPFKTISFLVGTYVSANIPRRDDQTVKLNGSLIPTAFYEFIAAKIPVVTPGDNIRQRIPNQNGLDLQPLKFRFVIGGDELNTYLEVASPSTSILETKPEYTNIINGVGLFSSRGFDFIDSYMSKTSWDYLVDGEITAGRNFCHRVTTNPKSCY